MADDDPPEVDEDALSSSSTTRRTGPHHRTRTQLAERSPEEDEQSHHVVRRDTRMTLEPLWASETTEDDEEVDDDAATAPQQRREEWWATLASGGVAGVVSRTCVAPLERLKILFQVQGLSAKGAPLRHVGVLQSLWDLYRKEGVRGLWKGNGLNCVRVFPSSAVQFASYRLYKFHFFGDDGTRELAAWQHVVAGGLAGATSTTLTYPLDLMRARRTVDFRGDVPTGLVSGLRHVYLTEGLRGVYRGIVPSLCGIVPYIGIDFAVYDLLKRECRKRGFGVVRGGQHHEGGEGRHVHHHRELSPFTKLVCGCLAGVCGMTVAFPFDTARRNLQVATLKVRPVPRHMLDILGGIIKEGGPRALYRGILPNYLKAAPSVGISFATFESVKPLFDESCR